MEAGKRISPDQKQVDGRWYWPDSWGYRKALEIKIKRLQAIVDKLPKTADGVHIVPGMVLWFIDRRKEVTVREVVISSLQNTIPMMVCARIDGGEQSLSECDCYSTREAALVDEYSSSSSERTTSYLSKYPIPADPSGVRGGNR